MDNESRLLSKGLIMKTLIKKVLFLMLLQTPNMCRCKHTCTHTHKHTKRVCKWRCNPQSYHYIIWLIHTGVKITPPFLAHSLPHNLPKLPAAQHMSITRYPAFFYFFTSPSSCWSNLADINILFLSFATSVPSCPITPNVPLSPCFFGKLLRQPLAFTQLC